MKKSPYTEIKARRIKFGESAKSYPEKLSGKDIDELIEYELENQPWWLWDKNCDKAAVRSETALEHLRDCKGKIVFIPVVDAFRRFVCKKCASRFSVNFSSSYQMSEFMALSCAVKDFPMEVIDNYNLKLMNPPSFWQRFKNFFKRKQNG